MTVRAPFDGIMGLTNLQIGDYIAVGTPIASLDDRTALLVEFTVPESVAPQIKKGLPLRASLITRTGEVHQGTIDAVGTRMWGAVTTADSIQAAYDALVAVTDLALVGQVDAIGRDVDAGQHDLVAIGDANPGQRSVRRRHPQVAIAVMKNAAPGDLGSRLGLPRRQYRG